MTHVSPEEAIEEAKKRNPDAAEEAERMDWGTFTAEDFEETIRKDVKTLRNSKLLAGMDILGFKLITETGVVEPVEA